MSSWVYDAIRSANRIELLKPAGPGSISIELKAEIAREFCLRYWMLLTNSTFGRDVELVADHFKREKASIDLHCDFAKVMRLLLEAGAEGQVAYNVVSAAEQEMAEFLAGKDKSVGRSHRLGPGKFEQFVDSRRIFGKVQAAKSQVCALSKELAEEAETAGKWSSIKHAGTGLGGLSLIGLAALPQFAALFGSAAVSLELSKAVVSAIGGAAFSSSLKGLGIIDSEKP